MPGSSGSDFAPVVDDGGLERGIVGRARFTPLPPREDRTMAKPQQNITSQLDRAQELKASRPVNVFEVPEELRLEIEPDMTDAMDDVVEIGMRILTPGEERLAIKQAGNEAGSILYNLNCAALVYVRLANDEIKEWRRPGEAMSALNRLHPKVRELVTLAYNDMHRPKQEISDGFLKTRKVRV